MAKTPNPGSSKAVAQGCTCSQTENAYGKGTGGTQVVGGLFQPVFAQDADCPLHGAAVGFAWNDDDADDGPDPEAVDG